MIRRSGRRVHTSGRILPRDDSEASHPATRMDARPGARSRDKERRLSHPGACGSPRRRRRWAQPLLPRSRGLRRDKRLFARKTNREPDRRRVTSTTACPAEPRKGVRASIWGTTTCACLVKWAGITPPVRDINTSFAADAGLIGRSRQTGIWREKK